MGVFQIFKIVQMVQNRATHLNKSTTFKKVVAKAVDQKLPEK